MKNDPLISVVIPCYNDGAFLPETIRRVKEQTLKDFEIIISNDGSTDEKTLSVLEDLGKQGIHVVHQQNKRMSAARNFGVAHAKGKYIATLDADDYFDPSFFEKATRILEAQPNTAVVTSYIKRFGEGKKVFRPRSGDPNNLLFTNQYTACVMVRKSCWDEIGGYDEKMVNGFEDWEFYIRIVKKGWDIHVIPEKLFFYRQTEKSTYKKYTVTNRKAIVDYIVEKHKDWYVQKLKELITDETVLYKNARVSWQNISKMFMDRINKKYS